MVTPPETSVRRASPAESHPGRWLQLGQWHGQADHTQIHSQAVKYKISFTSASTPVGYQTHMGDTPGPLRGVTGCPPSPQAARSPGRGRWRQGKCGNCNRLGDQPKEVCRCRQLGKLRSQPGRLTGIYLTV